MSWSYRICKTKIKKTGQRGYYIKYSIKEVYTNPKRHTIDDLGAVAFLEEDTECATEQGCIESIRRQLTMMLMDTYKPIYKIK